VPLIRLSTAARQISSAVMIPQVLSLIQRTFTGAARARAMSAYSAVLAGGVIVGQIAGGFLVSADLLGTTWRPVFLLNVPIGAALLLAFAVVSLNWRRLPERIWRRLPERIWRRLPICGLPARRLGCWHWPPCCAAARRSRSTSCLP
jgi:MFS family permease